MPSSTKWYDRQNGFSSCISSNSKRRKQHRKYDFEAFYFMHLTRLYTWVNLIICKNSLLQSKTGWSNLPEDKATKYRLTIKDIQQQESGTYTCASPRGLTNSIVIIVTSNLSKFIFADTQQRGDIRFYGSSRIVFAILRNVREYSHH